MDANLLTNGLNDPEKLQFQREFKRKAKSKGLAIFWAILLGGLGAHRFYMGETGLGILYVCFVWTAIPMIVALVEAIFFMGKRVEEYNETTAQEIVLKLRAMRQGA